ncbi:MAG TPA: hypothetical protein PKZ84_17655 [Anaerolineae bacterium]|nr:hypothetical protein [Anaerolineae bacterium]HQI86400.1 hypothetical protein [Anaerolineae bacterium]
MKRLGAGFAGMARMLLLILLLGVVTGCSNRDVLTDNLAEPLNGAKAAKFDINAGDGNLSIDRLTGGEPLLAGGELQYLEKQGQPARTLVAFLDEVTLTLQGGEGEQPRIRFPWAACNGATEWNIHLNPTVSSDITAHSDGGNVKLDLSGMVVTHVSADTGGGNIDVVLPDSAIDLSVTAKTGAGNVSVYISNGVAARIRATTGLGKVIMDPRFSKIADDVYQSTDFETAANRIEITARSGAGNVSINS